MTTTELSTRLDQMGRRIARRRALLLAAFVLPAAGLLLWLGSILDLYLRFGRLGRIAWWALFAAATVCAVYLLVRTWTRNRSPESVAAELEHAFPELDNQLINHVQFTRQSEAGALRQAYLRENIVGWAAVHLGRLRNRTREKQGLALVGILVALMLLPTALRGRAWGVALWRVANPFANCPPVSLTRILNVSPGTATRRQGRPVVLECTVAGKPGHRVRLDIDPADDAPTTYELGALRSRAPQDVRHRIARLSDTTRYRFRAGDAVDRQWYTLTGKPPLSVTAVTLRVEPPAYTRRPSKTFNGLIDRARIPEGATVTIVGRCNQALTSVHAGQHGEDDDALALAEQAENSFTGTVPIVSAAPLRLLARDKLGDQTEVTLVHTFVPDKPPEIQVLAPRERAHVPPGAVPRIRFDVRDDHGISRVQLEPAGPAGGAGTNRDPVMAWPTDGHRRLVETWVDTSPMESLRDQRAFRIVALDNATPPNRSASAAVRFDVVSPHAAEETERRKAAALGRTLAHMVTLQRENVTATERLTTAPTAASRDDWNIVTDRQQKVRDVAAELLRDPRRPLGPLATTVKALYLKEMVDVVALLTRIPRLETAQSAPLAAKALALEKRILRRIAFTQTAAKHEDKQRRVADVLSMLAQMIKSQEGVRTNTATVAEHGVEVGRTLVDKQDELAGDVSALKRTCQRDARELAPNDPDFAERLEQVDAEIDKRAVKADMLRAAEKLDTNAAGAALPLQDEVIADLRACHDMLNAWRIAQVDQRIEDMVSLLGDAGARLGRLRQLEGRVIDAMKQLNAQPDEAGDDRDMFEEEVAELRKQTEEAMLQVARDLHTFPELSVANELVDDVYSVFEEINQVPGSEEWGAEAVKDMGTLKPEELLDLMEQAEDHVESMEQWLADKPDIFNFDMEPFDAEELPRMALGGLESSIEDLIGDLIEESQELADAAEDTATNQGVSQNPIPGWEVAEGPTESFGAQGKSGNQVPDHKEQSGRSLVGREGQAVGETAAGTGTISEGDKHIEKRMTPDPLQSGQVQADGEASENATGGGKQASGAADDVGMSGGLASSRMDAAMGGSVDGLRAMMAKADSIYVKASLMNVRTEALGDAAHHIRQANDAIAAGLPSVQVRELQRRAVVALKNAKTSLASGFTDDAIAGPAVDALDDAVEGTVNCAPPEYRELVADYFRSLNDTL